MGRESENAQRIFVALDPPREVREQLAGWVRTASLGPKARPMPPDSMHLTLAFLGSRSEHEAELASGAMEESIMPVHSLATGAPAWLPKRRPRVLAVEVRDESGEELAALQQGLAGLLAEAIGYEPPKGFRPHVTVARFGRGARPSRELPPTPALSFSADSVSVYRSILSPQGSRYEALHTVDLARLAPDR